MFKDLYSVEPGSYINFSLVEEKVIDKGSVSYWQPVITNEIKDLETATDLISNSLEDSMKDGLRLALMWLAYLVEVLTQV